VAQRWLGRRWFAALLFTALFSRALIPVGFMPAAGGIILCSGYASVGTSGMDMPGMQMPGMDMSGNADHGGGSPPPRHGTELCPFSAVASVMAAGHAPTPTALTLVDPTVIVFPPEQSIPRGTLVPTSLPRGPPRSA
jgi:hypothetical protein